MNAVRPNTTTANRLNRGAVVVKGGASHRQVSRGRTADGKPNPIDCHVGARVRLRRTLLGLSQEKLGEALGLTFQQVQKYERGANRIGASRLFDVARILDVPISFFFDDMDDQVAAASPKALKDGAAAPELAQDPMHTRRMLDLARNLSDIDEDTQAQLCRTIAAVADAQRKQRGEG